MNRRIFIAGVGTLSITTIAGCNDNDNDEDNDEDGIDAAASDLILSEDDISDDLPGDWEIEETRPPDSEPVGFESAEIKVLSGESADDEVDFGVVVFDTIENTETFMDDEREEDDESEEIGDESFSGSALGVDYLLVRVENVIIQISGTPHISNLRILAETQATSIDER